MKGALHPAYWGSLLSLFFVAGISLLQYIQSRDTTVDDSPAFAIVSVVLCLLISIRYYVAASITIYTTKDKTIIDLPYPLNLICFVLLSTLILMCNFMIAATAIYTPEIVIKNSLFIVLTSASMTIFICISSLFRPKTIKRPPNIFIFVDILLMILIISINFSGYPGSSDKSMLSGLILAAVVFALLQEGSQIFFRPIQEQLVELWSKLKKLS